MYMYVCFKFQIVRALLLTIDKFKSLSLLFLQVNYIFYIIMFSSFNACWCHSYIFHNILLGVLLYAWCDVCDDALLLDYNILCITVFYIYIWTDVAIDQSLFSSLGSKGCLCTCDKYSALHIDFFLSYFFLLINMLLMRLKIKHDSKYETAASLSIIVGLVQLVILVKQDWGLWSPTLHKCIV